tara:strand:+ start:275 stop:586 length:312 start_codon:yes stop_codon:yes gene_type:complete
MATTITWKIAQLDRETADGYVFTAYYTVDAADDTYNANAYGSIGFDKPETLIPYQDLTEEVVIGWVKDNIGGEEKVQAIESALQARLDEQRTPTKAAGLPWSN